MGGSRNLSTIQNSTFIRLREAISLRAAALIAFLSQSTRYSPLAWFNFASSSCGVAQSAGTSAATGSILNSSRRCIDFLLLLKPLDGIANPVEETNLRL